MKPRLAVFLSLLILVPSLGAAQRGRGGGGRDPEMRRMANEQEAGVRYATKADIEQLSPAGFLADKRKKLQLDDKAVDALKAAEASARTRNKELLTAYDSVRREVQKFSGGDRPDTENDRVLRQMAFGNLRKQVNDARAADRAAALAALPDDKRPAAEDLLKDNDRDYDAKMGTGGRGRRGGH